MSGAFFDRRLQCHVARLEYDWSTRTGILWLPERNCTDMAGAIRLFQAIHDQVERIECFVEREGDSEARMADTLYTKVEGQWRAQCFGLRRTGKVLP